MVQQPTTNHSGLQQATKDIFKAKAGSSVLLFTRGQNVRCLATELQSETETLQLRQ